MCNISGSKTADRGPPEGLGVIPRESQIHITSPFSQQLSAFFLWQTKREFNYRSSCCHKDLPSVFNFSLLRWQNLRIRRCLKMFEMLKGAPRSRKGQQPWLYDVLYRNVKTNYKFTSFDRLARQAALDPNFYLLTTIMSVVERDIWV